MNEKLYFAYGSNINLNQMDVRCPDARVVGPAVLEGYELLFRGNSRGCGVATIAPNEGFPHLYRKEQVVVRDNAGRNIPVMAYVMTGVWRSPALPSLSYYYGIQEGFWQNSLPLEPLQ